MKYTAIPIKLMVRPSANKSVMHAYLIAIHQSIMKSLLSRGVQNQSTTAVYACVLKNLWAAQEIGKKRQRSTDILVETSKGMSLL